MAREGLRTLVVAKKALTAEEYEDFDARYAQCRACVLGSFFTAAHGISFVPIRLQAAKRNIVNRDAAVMDVRMTLETDLELLVCV